jgi:hypothetical protein
VQALQTQTSRKPPSAVASVMHRLLFGIRLAVHPATGHGPMLHAFHYGSKIGVTTCTHLLVAFITILGFDLISDKINIDNQRRFRLSRNQLHYSGPPKESGKINRKRETTVAPVYSYGVVIQSSHVGQSVYWQSVILCLARRYWQIVALWQSSLTILFKASGCSIIAHC